MPTAVNTKEAALKLDFIVVGGGVYLFNFSYILTGSYPPNILNDVFPLFMIVPVPSPPFPTPSGVHCRYYDLIHSHLSAGLAGLAVAFTLCKAGHRVRVLEKQPALGAPSSGLRVPPNMSKILRKWVGADELAKVACLNVATPWYDCEPACFSWLCPIPTGCRGVQCMMNTHDLS